MSIAYAVRHPERVERRVLLGGYPKGWSARSNPEEIEEREAMHKLMEKGWGKDNPAFRQVFTSLFVPGATPAGLVELMKRCLVKDPDARLRDVQGIRLRLAALEAPGHAMGARVRPWVWVFGALAVLFAAILAYLLLHNP